MDTCCGLLHVKYLVEFDLECAFWDQTAVIKDWESSISHSGLWQYMVLQIIIEIQKKCNEVFLCTQ